MQNYEQNLAAEATSTSEPASPASASNKAPYWAPQLTSHGQLERVTRAASDGDGENTDF